MWAKNTAHKPMCLASFGEVIFLQIPKQIFVYYIEQQAIWSKLLQVWAT